MYASAGTGRGDTERNHDGKADRTTRSGLRLDV